MAQKIPSQGAAPGVKFRGDLQTSNRPMRFCEIKHLQIAFEAGCGYQVVRLRLEWNSNAGIAVQPFNNRR